MNVEVKIKNPQKIDQAVVDSLSSQLKLDRKLVELLCLRGIDSFDAINAFLYPDKSMFHDPLLMKGMREAVDRLKKAIENDEKIVVYGDYDADGVSAAAILSLYLSSCGLEVFVHIPNRVGDGYGLNVDTLEKILESHMPDLILTCDCGISGAKEVQFAMDLGVDVIVTDHHEVSGDIPECIVVNPKQSDCNYPCSMLCGAGVALKLVEAMSDRDTMLKFTDLACVATIADLVPLTDENRLIVQFGLKRLSERKNIGLSVLFDNIALKTVTSGDIAYKVAPRINAAGRMGDAFRAFELLTTKSVSRAQQIVDEIDGDNCRRKEMCDEMYDEAIVDVMSEDLISNRAIVLSHPAWEKGITGILAARLAGDFHRPVFVLVNSGDTYKGTCRSIEGINVHDLLIFCREHLVEFGGHAQAAGFSILPEKIDDFKRAVNEYLKSFPDELFVPKAYYDTEIELSDVNYNFVKSLELIEPIGHGNARPLFKIEAENVKIAPCKNNSSHISVTLDSGLQIFAFNYSKISYQLMSAGKKQIITELQPNTYSAGQIKGIMRSCVPSSLYINDSTCDGFEYGLLNHLPTDNAKYALYNYSDLDAYASELYGTLIIAPDRETYENYVNNHKTPIFHEFTYAISRNNFTRVMVAPVLDNANLSLPNYKRIVFLRAPLNNGVIAYLNKITDAEILIPREAENKYAVSADRAVFGEYFDAIKQFNAPASSLNSYFRALSKVYPQLNIQQFMFCVRVFEELGIITLTDSPFTLTVNQGVRADLNKSEVYKLIRG